MPTELTKNFESFLDNNTPGGYIQTNISITNDDLQSRINETLNSKGYLTNTSPTIVDMNTAIQGKQAAGNYVTQINSLTGTNISLTAADIPVATGNSQTVAESLSGLSGYENTITSISVNGVNIAPNNKNVNITVPVINNTVTELGTNAVTSSAIYNMLKQCCFPIIQNSSTTIFAALGETAQLWVGVSGYNPITYQWRYRTAENNTPTNIVDATSNIYNKELTSVDDFDKFYECLITDGFGNSVQTIGMNIVRLYKVQFNANEGAGTMEDYRVQIGQSFYTPACTFIRDGYTFQKWSTNALGTDTYNSNDIVTPNDDMTFYAIWQAN